MILGGLIGFLIGISFGLAQGSAWPAVIWRASIATVLSGILLRWWARIWMQSLRNAQRERLSVEARDAAASSAGGKRQA